MNPFRLLHEFCNHHSTSDVIDFLCIRSPDGIAVCRVRMVGQSCTAVIISKAMTD